MSPTRRLAGLPSGRITKWVVLGIWVVIFGVAGPLSAKLTGAQENDQSAWVPGSAESTEAFERYQAFQPGELIPTVLVYERTSGITPADQAAVTQHVTQLANVEGVVEQPAGPVAAQDGQALQVIAQIEVGEAGWEQLGEVVDEIKQVTETRPDGLSMFVTGPGGYAADSVDAFAGIDSSLLYAAVTVVVIILLLMYRSPVLWILPVFSAFAALTAAQAVVYLLAEHAGLTVNAQSAGILLVLVFGAGTDYALLLVARYREELRRHEDRHEAMALAMHRAGPALIASAATVVAGMLCLLVALMNPTRGLGPVLAIGIAVALLAMLTLLPALLVILGRWIFWPVRPTFGSREPTETGLWARVGSVIARRPRTTWIVTAGLLGVLALGLVDLRTGIIASRDSFTNTVDAVTGEDVLARHFPAGTGQPVIVLADAAAASQVRSAVSATDGVVEATEPAVVNDQALIQATLRDAPDSPAAMATIDRLRDTVHAVPNADAVVGGTTAYLVDYERASDRDSRVIMPLILLVVLVILGLLLRAVIAPILLVATVVVSFAAALGISVFIFEHLFGFPGVDSSFPLFVFVFLVALGIDYNIFLMTRVHEEANKHGTRRGALIGLASTGGVITAAGLVLAGTFAVLATIPIVAFAEIGFAVALGIMLDTMIVRSVLVTALNLDIGPKIWWPSRLANKPDVEVGDELTDEATPAPAH
ncbi:MAG: MMPL family transporter [Sporichthyaceae bacterium]|nr:MMPL family transporter [Sporichthyaceae bacterium]